MLSRFEALFVATDQENEDPSVRVCQAVAEFRQKTGFLPKRQNACRSEEQRSEDALAQRWDRLVEQQQRGDLSGYVLNRFEALFVATDQENEDPSRQVCQAVAEFLENYGVLPRRQNSELPEKQAEDALAQRLNRLLSHKVEPSQDLLEEFAVVFEACAGRWNEAEKGGLANFLETTSVCEVFAMCSNLNEDSVQRFVGSNSNDFKAACVAWLLEKFEQGHEELSGLAVDGLDEFDDTKAVREELKEYVFKSGSLPPVAAGNRSADESRLQKALVQVRKRRVQRVRSTRNPEDQVRLKTGSEVIHNSEVNINLLGKSCLTSEKVNWSNNLKSIHANSLRFCSIACGNTWFFLHVTGSKIEHLQFFEMFFWVFLCLHESLKLYLTSSFGRKTSWIYMALQLSCFWSFLQEPSFYRSFASVLELPLSNLIHLYLAQNVSLESKKQYESKHSLSNNSQITLCCVFLLPTNSQLTLKAKLSAQPQE